MREQERVYRPPFVLYKSTHAPLGGRTLYEPYFEAKICSPSNSLNQYLLKLTETPQISTQNKKIGNLSSGTKKRLKTKKRGQRMDAGNKRELQERTKQKK